nr:hypothetical protein GCM10020093_069850 [Planobispora longispora]
MRPGNLLVVQLILQLILAVTACGLLLAVAGTVLGAHLPTRVPYVALVFLLGTASMFAIGLLIAALAPNGRAANGIGVLLYFPMAYLAGLMQPKDQMPAMVARIGEYTLWALSGRACGRSGRVLPPAPCCWVCWPATPWSSASRPPSSSAGSDG